MTISTSLQGNSNIMPDREDFATIATHLPELTELKNLWLVGTSLHYKEKGGPGRQLMYSIFSLLAGMPV